MRNVTMLANKAVSPWFLSGFLRLNCFIIDGNHEIVIIQGTRQPTHKCNLFPENTVCLSVGSKKNTQND